MPPQKPTRIRPAAYPGPGFKRFFSPQPLGSKTVSVRGIGIREAMPACLVERPQGTGDYLIMLFHDEAQIGTSPSMRPTDCPDTMMIWPPGKGQFYGNPLKGFVHSWIHCEGRRIRHALRQSRLPLAEPFPVGNISHFQQTLLDVHAEVVSYMPPDEIFIGNLLENCFRELARQLRGVDSGIQVPERMLAVHRLIAAVPDHPIILEKLASMAGMSPSHFSAQFRKTFGLAPMECLIQHRMHRAAHLLSDHNLTVSEIARLVGYEDAFHFSKTFRKHFGASPRAMRQRRELTEN